MERLFARRTRAMVSWTQFSEDPELISLAGGLPDTALFGADRHADLLAAVARSASALALQYGPTRGLARTNACAREVMRAEGLDVAADELIVTTGGQQVIDLVCRTFLEPGDVVVAEGPTFPGALLSFGAHEADVVQVATDADGMRTDLLAETLAALRRAGRTVKLVYCVPNFQNPGGSTMSLARRHELLAIARTFDLPVFEDNPYGLLRFEGEPLPTIRSLDPDGRVLYLGTFSKILAPGLRVGWLVAPPAVLEKVDLGKQCADLCAPTTSQLLIGEYFARCDWRAYVDRQVDAYRERRDAMVEAVHEHLPPASSFVVPAGGLFLWIRLPDAVDTRRLLELAMRRHVAFVPGAVGYARPGAGASELRLNFTACDPERIHEGVRRLGQAIRALPPG